MSHQSFHSLLVKIVNHALLGRCVNENRYRRTCFDCKILLNANCEYSKNLKSKTCKIKIMWYFSMTRDHKMQSLDLQYCNRESVQSKPVLRYIQ